MAKLKRIPKMSLSEAQSILVELNQVKANIDLLEERKEFLISRLSTYIDTVVSPDDKGHRTFTVLNGNKIINFYRQCRKKIILDEDKAKKYLAKRGLDSALIKKEIISPEVTEDQIVEALLRSGQSYFVDAVEIVDEAELKRLVEENIIPMNDFEDMADIQITYANIVKEEKSS